MRKPLATAAVLFVAILLAACFVSSSAFAATIVKHEKIVAKDGSGDYTTITAALNSITNASPTYPYLIKVRPGTYDERISTKQYVSIEGSGSDMTFITASSSPTVSVATNSAIRNVKIMNTASTGKRIGLSFYNATASAENVGIELSNGQWEQWGVYVDGASTVDLKNLSIKIVYGSGQGSTYGVYVQSGAAPTTISDSHITIDGGTIGHSGELTAFRSDYSPFSVRDSVLETINNGDHYTVQCYYNSTDSQSITGSKVTAIGTDDAYKTAAIYGMCEVKNSEVRAKNMYNPLAAYSFGSGGGGGSGKVAASLIQGAIEIPMKIVNCWDQNYDPIPNQ